MAEQWVDIAGYEGFYQVSSLGRIKTVERYEAERNRIIRGRIRAPIEVHGYLYCELWKCGKHKRYAVHRLVATAFIPNPDGKPQVNHLDGDKTNNSVTNLEWCTASENEHHAYEFELTHAYNRSGDKNPMYGKHHTERAKQMIKAVHVGLRHTEEAKKKMSKAHKGRKFTEEHKRNLGKILSAKKMGMRKMTNGNETRFVLKDDIPQKLKEGWLFTSKRQGL